MLDDWIHLEDFIDFEDIYIFGRLGYIFILSSNPLHDYFVVRFSFGRQ